MSIEFRPATPTDLDVLTGYMRDFYVGERIPIDDDRFRTAALGLMAEPAYGRLLVIMIEDKPIGYLALTFGYSVECGGRDAFVDELYVVPAWRGQGAGTATLQHAEAVCRTEGILALRLEVEYDHVAARALYERLGYVAHERHIMTKGIGSRAWGIGERSEPSTAEQG